jgi:hypothetical protein
MGNAENQQQQQHKVPAVHPHNNPLQQAAYFHGILKDKIPQFDASNATPAEILHWIYMALQGVSVFNNAPPDVVKQVLLSKLDRNTRAQLQTFLTNPAHRPPNWPPNWMWPMIIGPDMPVWLIIARILMAIRVGREMLPMLLNELKPQPQDRKESVASFHTRVLSLRSIHEVYHRLQGTQMVNTEQFDTQLKQGYRSSLTNEINERIAARVAEQQALLPAGKVYVPTVLNYMEAALKAEQFENKVLQVSVAHGAVPYGLAGEAGPSGFRAHPFFTAEPGNSLVDVFLHPKGHSAGAASSGAINAANEARFALLEKLALKALENTTGSTAAPAAASTKRKKQVKLPEPESDSSEEEAPAPKRQAKESNDLLKKLQSIMLLADGGKAREFAKRCFNCRKPHSVRDCPEPARPDLKCSHCKGLGHFNRDCPTLCRGPVVPPAEPRIVEQ